MAEPTHIRRFEVERLLAGELAEADTASLTGHAAVCAECGEKLAALRADLARFADEKPYAAFRVEHEKRRAVATPRRSFWLGLGGFGVASATAAFVLLAIAGPEGSVAPSDLGAASSDPSADAETTRTKGGPVRLDALTMAGSEVRALLSGEKVGPGAILQLGYAAGGHSHLGLVGVDGFGRVSLYFPESGNRLAPAPAGDEGRFPFSLTLDAAPGAERFVAFFANEPLAMEPLIEVARKAAGKSVEALPLPDNVGQASLWLEK